MNSKNKDKIMRFAAEIAANAVELMYKEKIDMTFASSDIDCSCKKMVIVVGVGDSVDRIMDSLKKEYSEDVAGFFSDPGETLH